MNSNPRNMASQMETCKIICSSSNIECKKPIDYHRNEILCNLHYLILKKDYTYDSVKFYNWKFITPDDKVAFTKFLKSREYTKKPEPISITIPRKPNKKPEIDSDSESIIGGSNKKRKLTSYLDEETEDESTCIEMPITKRQNTNHNTIFDLEKYVVADKEEYEQIKKDRSNYIEIIRPSIVDAINGKDKILDNIHNFHIRRANQLEYIINSFHKQTTSLIFVMYNEHNTEHIKIMSRAEAVQIKKNSLHAS